MTDGPNADEVKLEAEVWKEALSNQRHFNDILLRLRSLCFTYLGVIAALAGYLGKTTGSEKSSTDTPTVLKLLEAHPKWVLAAMAPLLGVYLLDRFYYHGLLLGSVTVGAAIEKRSSRLPMMGAVLRATSRAMSISSADAESSVKVTIFYGISILPFVGLAFDGWGVTLCLLTLVLIELLSERFQKPKLEAAKQLVWQRETAKTEPPPITPTPLPTNEAGPS